LMDAFFTVIFRRRQAANICGMCRKTQVAWRLQIDQFDAMSAQHAGRRTLTRLRVADCGGASAAASGSRCIFLLQ